MYYIIAFAVYIVTLSALMLAFKKLPNKKRMFAKAAGSYTAAMKESTRSRNSRRYRKMKRARTKKALPLSHRFLYRLWMVFCISLFIIIPVAIWASRDFVMGTLYAPPDVVTFSYGDNSPTIMVLLFAGMVLGIVLSMGFSYLTYIPTIRNADAVYQTGSFQTYSVKFNILLAFLLLLISLPPLIMSYNAYRYTTEDAIVVKPAFAFTERIYPFSEVDFVERRRTGRTDSLTRDYIAVMQNGTRVRLHSGNTRQDLSGLYAVFEMHGIEVINAGPLANDEVRAMP